MNIPDGMPEELKKMLSMIFGDTHDSHSNWIQVGRLEGADIMRRKKEMKRADNIARQMGLLKNKAEILNAKNNHHSTNWWNRLHKKYSLPSDGNFHITDDNRILMEPKKAKNS